MLTPEQTLGQTFDFPLQMSMRGQLPAFGGPLAAMAPIDVLNQPPAAAPASFVWGANSKRMTPDEIDAQRKIAEAQMQGGMDYSPVGSWAQGLARVAQGLLGGFEERKLDKAATANDDYNSRIIASLTGGGGDPTAGGAPGSAPSGPDAATLLRAMSDPYASDAAKSIAKMQYERNFPAAKQPTGDEALLVAAGYVPGTPEYQAAARGMIDKKDDPVVTASLPNGGFYAGRQSGLMAAIMGGGGQPSGATAGTPPPATLPPDFDFGDGGPKQPASGTFR